MAVVRKPRIEKYVPLTIYDIIALSHLDPSKHPITPNLKPFVDLITAIKLPKINFPQIAILREV